MTASLASFPDRLDLRWSHDAVWVLLASFRCVHPRATVVVPAGFHTDLASIPRILRSALPVVGPQNLPAVIHDYLYRCGGRCSSLRGAKVLTRYEADLLFLEGLEALGVSPGRAYSMYLGVRIGGRCAFRVPRA